MLTDPASATKNMFPEFETNAKDRAGRNKDVKSMTKNITQFSTPQELKVVILLYRAIRVLKLSLLSPYPPGIRLV